MAGLSIRTEELGQRAAQLSIGEKLLLTGLVYTARDAAHKRIMERLGRGESLPFPLEGAVIYHAGPTPSPLGKVIGSCGPTTSGRMDPFAPALFDRGLAAVIGKGERSEAVRASIVRNKAVYLCAIGGAGALAARCVTSCEVIAFEDLGCEAVRALYVKDFPVIVCNDAKGGDLFSYGRQKYCHSHKEGTVSG